ncbi:hypothetical protein C8J56DRAFT_538908 [Mycena floridula]|nr:hypothetical protein C8J56DRAFT_538908 [Mycena floridula]
MESKSTAPSSKTYVPVLPVELLAEIFFLCTSQVSLPVSWQKEPWNLTHVCQRWRETAISRPGLWSDVELKGRYNGKLLELIIEYSATLPLNVNLSSDEELLDEAHPIVQILLPTSSRWKSAELDVLHIEALTPIHGNIDSLQQLSINFRKRAYEPGPLAIFKVAPALRILNVDDYDGVAPTLQMPWASITEFVWDSDHSGNAQPFLALESARDLTSIKINTTMEAEQPITQPITLHNVQKFDLFAWYSDDVDFMLEQLTLPALTRLHIFHAMWDLRDLEALHLFQSRSQFNLKDLAIGGVKTTEHAEAVVTLLSQCNDVTELLLDQCSLQEILRHIAEPGKLPNLQVFKIMNVMQRDLPFNTRNDIEQMGDLLDMLESRLFVSKGSRKVSSSCSLKEVLLLNDRNFEAELSSALLTRVNAIRQAGLRFSIGVR